MHVYLIKFVSFNLGGNTYQHKQEGYNPDLHLARPQAANYDVHQGQANLSKLAVPCYAENNCHYAKKHVDTWSQVGAVFFIHVKYILF